VSWAPRFLRTAHRPRKDFSLIPNLFYATTREIKLKKKEKFGDCSPKLVVFLWSKQDDGYGFIYFLGVFEAFEKLEGP